MLNKSLSYSSKNTNAGNDLGLLFLSSIFETQQFSKSTTFKQLLSQYKCGNTMCLVKV